MDAFVDKFQSGFPKVTHAAKAPLSSGVETEAQLTTTLSPVGGAGADKVVPELAWYGPIVHGPLDGLAFPKISKHSAPKPGLGWPLHKLYRLLPAPISGEFAVGAQFAPTEPLVQAELSLKYAFTEAASLAIPCASYPVAALQVAMVANPFELPT